MPNRFMWLALAAVVTIPPLACGGSYSGGPACLDQSAPRPAVVATLSSPVRSFALDLTNVYVTTDGGDVVFLPLAGGASTVVASGQRNPSSVAVGAGGVAWLNADVSNGDPPSISFRLVVAAHGGAPLDVDSGPFRSALIAADDANVYVASEMGLERVPFDGGTPVAIDPKAVSSALAVDSLGVYWSNGSELMTLPVGTTQPKPMANLSAPLPLIATNSTAVYWLDVHPGASLTGIDRTQADHGAPRTLWQPTGLPLKLVVDESRAYVLLDVRTTATASDACGYKIVAVDLTSGAASEFVTGVPATLGRGYWFETTTIQQNDQSVFWFDAADVVMHAKPEAQ